MRLPEDHAGTPAPAACREGCSGPLDDADGCAALPWYHTKLCLTVLLQFKERGEKEVSSQSIQRGQQQTLSSGVPACGCTSRQH